MTHSSALSKTDSPSLCTGTLTQIGRPFHSDVQWTKYRCECGKIVHVVSAGHWWNYERDPKPENADERVKGEPPHGMDDGKYEALVETVPHPKRCLCSQPRGGDWDQQWYLGGDGRVYSQQWSGYARWTAYELEKRIAWLRAWADWYDGDGQPGEAHVLRGCASALENAKTAPVLA